MLDWARVAGYREGENPARWRGHLDKLLPARGKDDVPAADAAAQALSAAYPDVPVALARPESVGTAVPRGGKACAKNT